MSTAVIQLIVWAPFLIVALICGIIFGILGFKRGSARAGISVAATVVSSILAIVVSKLVSMLAAGLVSSYIVKLLADKAPSNIEIAELTAMGTGLAGGICSLALYIPVFLIIASILKPVISSITKKLPAVKSVGNRLGGLSISLADALIYSFLLLLPVYGTLAIANDVLDTAYIVTDNGKDGGVNATVADVRDYVSVPVVEVAGLPPFSTAYDTLITFKVEGIRVDLGGMVRSSCDLFSEVWRFTKSDDMYSDKEALVSLLDKSEAFIKKNEFITDFACTYGYRMLPKVKIPGVGKVEISEYYPSVTSGAMIREDVPAFFNLIEAMVESGMLDAVRSKNYDMSKVDAEMMSEALGRSFNHSPSIAAFKSRIMRALVTELTKELGEDDPAIKGLTDAIAGIPEAPLQGEAAKKEGESLYMIMSGMLTISDKTHSGKAIGLIIEGLARHPSVGVDKVADAADSLLSESGMAGVSTLTNTIKEKLNASVNKPITESTFPDFCDTAFNAANALGDVASGKGGVEGLKNLMSANPEILLEVKNTVSDELLAELGMGKEGEKLNTVIDAVFDAIIDADLNEEEAEKEAKALNELLSAVTDVSDGNTDAIVSRSEELIDLCADSVVIKNTLDGLNEEGKSDPTGLFTDLGDDAKAEISEKIDSYVAENGANETLNALKLFMGIN